MPEKCLIYEVKCSVFVAIYICNTHQKSKKRMDGHFSDLLCLLKNGQIFDSFAYNFEQHFKYTTSHTDLHKCTASKVVNHINPIGATKKNTKNNCNLCIEERLTLLKQLHDKHVTLVNKNSEIYGACRHKTTFH